MTEDDIIVAFECCSKGQSVVVCENCPFKSDGSIPNINCLNLDLLVLDLLKRNRQK